MKDRVVFATVGKSATYTYFLDGNELKSPAEALAYLLRIGFEQTDALAYLSALRKDLAT